MAKLDIQSAVSQIQKLMDKPGGASQQEIDAITAQVPKRFRVRVIQHAGGKWTGEGENRRFVYRGKSFITAVAIPVPQISCGQIQDYVMELLTQYPSGIRRSEFWNNIEIFAGRKLSITDKQSAIGKAHVVLKNDVYYPLRPTAAIEHPATKLQSTQVIEMYADEIQSSTAGKLGARFDFGGKVKLVIQIFGGKKE